MKHFKWHYFQISAHAFKVYYECKYIYLNLLKKKDDIVEKIYINDDFQRNLSANTVLINNKGSSRMKHQPGNIWSTGLHRWCLVLDAALWTVSWFLRWISWATLSSRSRTGRLRFAKNNVVQKIHHCDDLTTIDSSTKNFVAPEGENTPSRMVVMSSVEASLSTSLSVDDDFLLVLVLRVEGFPSWDKPKKTSEVKKAWIKYCKDKEDCILQ